VKGEDDFHDWKSNFDKGNYIFYVPLFVITVQYS